MSADNGIYILETLVKPIVRDSRVAISDIVDLDKIEEECAPKEYRVAHLFAIDDLYYYGQECVDAGIAEKMSVEEFYEVDRPYSELMAYIQQDTDIQIVNARWMWEGVAVLQSREEAHAVARLMLEAEMIEGGVVEYGIELIYIPRVF